MYIDTPGVCYVRQPLLFASVVQGSTYSCLPAGIAANECPAPRPVPLLLPTLNFLLSGRVATTVNEGWQRENLSLNVNLIASLFQHTITLELRVRNNGVIASWS